MFFNKRIQVLLLTLAMATMSFADRISPEALSNGGANTRDRQLKEIGEVMRGGQGGYLAAGTYYTPLDDQLPLQSAYGVHDGFAFRQRVAAFGAAQYSKNVMLGALLWFDRFGWDGEDFVFSPQYNDFSLIRSVTTWGVVMTNTNLDLTVAAGMQHQNVEYVGKGYPAEEDSLGYVWAHVRWNRFSLQGSFNGLDWRSFRVALDLESRPVFGGPKGWQTYLPNVSLGLYNGAKEDSLRLTWEQNIYEQRVYGEVAFDLLDGGFHSAALKFYPDPSRMIGFEATCLRRRQFNGSDDLLWGGAVDLMFLRVAYNAAYDYDRYFGAKGTLLVELKLDLSSFNGSLFARGGAVAAPMENNNIKAKNKDKAPESTGPIPLTGRPATSEPKVLESRGPVRYENGASKGGK